ncbi:autotransporter domain-containing protein [Actinobacillus equuli]|uniref:autotransporter domain-containing protein n=1 Tax=Actinobacillus equuli TaxID=718 RepID=UPI00244295E7|nr:autotransporter outer membrane beta-barrel domain-containing protein [Actinobacillus equuli]WGE46582.1 autotransporter domain-containing protein [Actinobacillus equuli subsp. haemolyticus]
MKFTKNRVAIAILCSIPTIITTTISPIAYAQTNVVEVSSQSDFERALAQAKSATNLTIRLTNDFTLLPKVNQNRQEIPWEIGNVTIDGANHTLTVRGSPLDITGDTVIRNTKLSFLPSQGLTLDLNTANQQEITQYIFVNGNRLELDNVDTQMGTNANKLSRPNIVMGNGTGSTKDSGKAELVLKNTIVKNILAGNLNDTAKQTNTKITLDKNSEVLQGVYFGLNSPNNVTGEVTVISETDKVGGYIGNQTNGTLELKGVNTHRSTAISGVKNLKLTQGSDLAVSDLEVENLSLENGTKLNTENTNFPISVQNLSGTGGTLIANVDSGSIDLVSATGNVNLDIRGWLDPNETYVSVRNNADGLTVTASQDSSLNVVKEGNSFKTVTPSAATPPATPAVVQQTGSSLKADEKPTADVPEITQKGLSLKADEKPAADVPEITQKGSGLKADEKPAADVPEITQKGSSLKADEKPAADVPEITQKGSSLKADEKPAADVPEITQKGSDLKADEKPAADVPEITQKGSSLKADEKPAADVPEITQKGSGLKADEKPTADIPEITQKGSSLKADEKPAADVPEITQKGSGLKADEKPTAYIPEITQKGSGLKADEKPTADIPEITQKGSGLKADEKPAADILTSESMQKGSGVTEAEKPAADTPEITQKGSSLTADEKSATDVPEITQKGLSLTADEKATANTPTVTEKGSSVTEAEKTAADVPETVQKGTAVTAEEKPSAEPVVQQKLASLTAEKPEVDTEALIAALRRAEMLLQQQQKAQRISNLVESNAAAQLNSIADVNMDIAQQVIEKFPTDGNQFRVWSNNTVTNSSAYRNTQQHYETDSFRSQLGVSGLVNANTQLGAILTDVRNSNDFAYNSGKHHLQIASAFVKYQTNNGTFAALDLGAGRIKNKLKSASQTDSFIRKLVQTGLTLGQELTWNQFEATAKTGIRYNHLGHANYQLDGLNVQEQAVDFVSYFAGLELGYKFTLGTQFSVKPLISAEYWVHNGDAEIKVADREFSLETGNRQHLAAGVEMGYQNLKLSLSAGVTDGSKVAKQNVAKLKLNYQF